MQNHNIISEAEVQKFRSETKGTTNKIHLNNAGASLPPNAVVDTVINYLLEEAEFGGYETEAKYQPALDHVYTLVARLINAEKDEIALTENASTAWGLAFNGITFNTGDEIITSEMEYITNVIGFLNVQKNQGVVIKLILNDEHGNFLLNELEKSISPKTRLIAVTHIASSTGGMLPIAEIGKIARKHNILYLVDACQSAGQVPLDVKEIGCDMLSATGRKYLRAPRGTGFLFVRKNIQNSLKLLLTDGSNAQTVTATDFKMSDNARRFELYEKSRALTLGFGKAVEYALEISLDRIWQRIQYLASQMRQMLAAIQGVTVHDTGDSLCGIVTFTVDGFSSPEVKTLLAEKGINVSVSQAKFTVYYMNKHHLDNVVRASVHYYNTDEEVRAFCKGVKDIF